jgi:hypothetical protein
MLTTDWVKKNLGSKAFDALRPIALSVFEAEYSGRINKYNFVAQLAPAMNKIMPQNDVWAQYEKNAVSVREFAPAVDKFFNSMKNATNIDELMDRKALLTKDGNLNELGELDKGIRRFTNYLAEETDPAKIIPKTCKKYVNENVPQEQKASVQQAIDGFVAKQDWSGLNDYIMKL